ncbi:MAG TPA: ABC transporter ATP-binding protein [Methylomirabilota bacterium]|nr:ABC transporter ATP-binding protein [Methylomirabilota bacterium]
MTPLLEVRGLDAYYGDSHILYGLSLDVAEGEVVCLLGRNGAGKSTTLKSIIGLVPPRSGRVALRGRALTGQPPFRIARAGLGYVPEERRIFGNLSVAENLEVARRTWTNDRGAPQAWTAERVLELFPHLRAMRDRPGGRLSGGEQQMLTIARTLMGSPAVLLLDEPSEGLAPLVVEMLAEQLTNLKRTGLAMLVAEQNVHFVSGLGDRVYILENGAVRYQGPMSAFLADDQVRRAHLAV